MSMMEQVHDRILRLSIRMKLFIAMMIVAIGVTAGVTWVALWQQEAVIESSLAASGRFIASSLADHIAELLAQSQYFEIREIANSIQQKDSRILFIAVNDLTTPRNEIVAIVGDDRWVRATQDIFTDRRRTPDATKLYVFFQPVQIRGVEKLLGTVRVGLSLKFMQDRLVQTRDLMLGLMAVSIAFSLLFGFILSAPVLKPLRTVMSGILKIAGGEFQHRIRVESRDETG